MELNTESKFHRLVAKWLIRFKRIKQVPVDINIANELVAPELPVSFAISIPSGTGDLEVQDVRFHLDEHKDVITADILCHFTVSVAGTAIYKTYLHLVLDGGLAYSREEKTITPTEVKVRTLQLIENKSSMIKDTRELLISYLPEQLKTLFISSFVMTDAILKRVGINDLTKYLTLYLSGSKQRILDYHHQEIENTIIHYVDSGTFSYLMDETVFEEQLFAEYGQDVVISDGHIYFIFHQE